MIKGPNHLDERIPIEVDGIQVNFCKNPQCPNFGVPASTKRQPRGKGSTERGRDTYNVVGSGRGTPMLRCGFCGQYPTIKSNKGIHEELIRFWKPFDTIATAPINQLSSANYWTSFVSSIILWKWERTNKPQLCGWGWQRAR